MISDNFRFDRRLSQKAKDVYQHIIKEHITHTQDTVLIKHLTVELGEDIDALKPFLDELIVNGYLEPSCYSNILLLVRK